MNKAILSGRLTRDPEVRYSQGEQATAIARYTLAVDRRGRGTKEGEQTADFISCVAFGKAGEFAEKYLKKGTKMIVTGRIQTGSYTNKEGFKVYTTEVVVEEQEFAESKNSSQGNTGNAQSAPNTSEDDGFMDIPDGIDEELPFN
ncbi:MAG: single-stranded DNA-binding protein [Butyrivibrio sp.]|nr:single-stranded DNA-binding protein [Butyrivibrio sp.]